VYSKLEIVCIFIAYYVIIDMFKINVHNVLQGLSKDHGDLKEQWLDLALA